MCNFNVLVLVFMTFLPLLYGQGEVLLEESSSEVLDVSGAAGGRIELPCDVTAALPADSLALVIWYKQGHPAPVYTYDNREDNSHWSDPATFGNRATFSTISTPAKLILEKLRPEDSGVYRCRVDYSRSPTKNFRLNLTVLIPPERLAIFINDEKELKGDVIGPFDEESQVNITCVAVGGRPMARVSWWKSHALLGNSDRSSTITLNLRREDLDSEVTCQALTDPSMTPISKTISIDLNLAPLWVKLRGANRTLVAGQKTDLVCQVAGARPKPSISWWKSGVRLTSVRESTDGNMTTSIVSFVPTVSDSGRMVSCRTVQPNIPNSTREDGTTMTIEYAPMVTLDLGSNLDISKIVEGSDVYLDCKIRANPWYSNVHFTHNGSPIKPGPGIIISNQSLVLQKISRELSGAYVCMARNSRGEGKSSPVHLDIKYSPSCKTSEPNVLRMSKGETIEMKCDMDANPSVNINYRWWFNTSSHLKKEIEIKDKKHEGILPYRIASTSDYGWLTCTASNQFGEISNFFSYENNNRSRPCVFHILPAERPSPVQSCTIDNITHDSLYVNCTKGDDGGMKQFFVLEVFETSTNKILTNTSSTEPHFHVRGLPASSSLAMRVKAANSRGVSRALTLAAKTLAPPQSDSRGSLPITVELSPLLLIVGGTTLALIVTSIFIVIAVKCKSTTRRRALKKDDESKSKINEEDRSSVPLTQTKVTDSIDSIDKNPDIIPLDSLPRDSSSNASTNDYSTTRPLLSRNFTSQHNAVEGWTRDISPQYMCTPIDLRRSETSMSVRSSPFTHEEITNYDTLIKINPGGLLTPEGLRHHHEYIPPPQAIYGSHMQQIPWSCATTPTSNVQFIPSTSLVSSCRGTMPIMHPGCYGRTVDPRSGVELQRLIVNPQLRPPCLNSPSLYEPSNTLPNTLSNRHIATQADAQTKTSL